MLDHNSDANSNNQLKPIEIAVWNPEQNSKNILPSEQNTEL